MADLRIPNLGESISEAVIAKWLKKVGETVAVDEPLVDLETDKVSVAVPAPAAGVLAEQRFAAGDTVKVGEVIGIISAGGAAATTAPANGSGNGNGNGKAAEAKAPVEAKATEAKATEAKGTPAGGEKAAAAALSSPDALGQPSTHNPEGPKVIGAPSEDMAPAPRGTTVPDAQKAGHGAAAIPHSKTLSPSVRKAIREGASYEQPAAHAPQQSTATQQTGATSPPQSQPQAKAPAPNLSEREEAVAMSPLRKRIAQRLVEAQHTAAILTTFNEVDMTAILGLRAKYQDDFVKRHGIKLGFMSFFVKACVEAAKQFPGVNAEVRGDHIIYKKHYDFGIAVGGGKGLVVPVVRNVDQLSLAGVEKEIARLAGKAKDNTLTLDELSNGTFSITNGGIYGSMMSTPLLNMPQTGILGMHNIIKRPIAVGDSVEIRPMMYIALSYDHRVVDGREAVQFLVAVKNSIESPERLVLEV